MPATTTRPSSIGAISVSLLLFAAGQPPPAVAHIEKGNMPDALAQMEYRILLEFEPDNTKVRNQLGMVLYRLGKLDEATRQFREVLRRKPNDFNAIDSLGLVALKRNRLQEALARFQKAVTIQPADVMVYVHLGETLERLDRRDEARAAYERARALLAQSAKPPPATAQERINAGLQRLKALARP